MKYTYMPGASGEVPGKGPHYVKVGADGAVRVDTEPPKQ